MRPAQTVRVNSWLSAARDGTSTRESGTHLGDKIRLPLQVLDGWHEGLEQQRVGWSSVERRVLEAAEDYLQNCASMKVDVEGLERLIKPENRVISLRYILKYSTRGGNNIFQLFDTSEKEDHFVANRKRWLESQGKTVHNKRVGKTSGMKLRIKE